MKSLIREGFFIWHFIPKVTITKLIFFISTADAYPLACSATGRPFPNGTIGNTCKKYKERKGTRGRKVHAKNTQKI